MLQTLDQEKATAIVKARKKGLTIEQTAEQLNIDKSTVNKYIRALNNPNSNIHNPKAYQEIKGKNKPKKYQLDLDLNKEITSFLLKRPEKEIRKYYDSKVFQRHVECLKIPGSNVYNPELADQIAAVQDNFKMQEKIEREKRIKQNLELIEKNFENGQTRNMMQKYHILSCAKIEEAMEELNNPNSSLYDVEKYHELKALEKEVSRIAEEEARNRFDFTPRNKAEIITIRVANHELTIDKAAQILGWPVSEYYQYLCGVVKKDLAPKLAPILAQYQRKSVNKQIPLYEHSPALLKELLMVVLTYRVPLESLEEWLHTTKEDINKAFFRFHLEESLLFLNREVEGKSKEINEQNYLKAKAYWKKRNQLLKEAKLAKKEQNRMQLDSVQLRLREHRQKVFDNEIVNILTKEFKVLNGKEREFIARYRIKYALPYETCSNLLHLEIEQIKQCERILVANDLIYATELMELNAFLDFQKEKKEIVVYEGKSR